MDYDITKEKRFESIYRACVDDVYRTCLHMTKDIYLAQDITQQAFVNFYDKFETVSEEYYKPYLIRSAKNLIYNHHRDSQYESQTDMTGNILNAEQVESAEDTIVNREKAEKIRAFTQEMLEKVRVKNEGWYQVLQMMYFSEKSHDEIAAELGITKEVLYSRLYRAKKWLTKHYQVEFEKLNK